MSYSAHSMPCEIQEIEFDESALRSALSCFATGVAVVTTRATNGTPIGLTVNSFNSVSLDPPLILWSIALGAPSLAAFRTHDAFAVNILAADQSNVCTRFANPARDKFSGIEWREGHAGVPLIEGTVAQFECRTHARHPGGDHEIYLGRVVAVRSTDRSPLVICRGTFSSPEAI